MARNSYRAKPQPQPQNKSEIKPAEDTTVKTQVKVMEVSTEPMPKPVIKTPALYKVQVTHPSLRRRAEPSTDSEVLGLITDKGEYEIFAEVGGWGKLKDSSWIMLQFCRRIKE